VGDGADQTGSTRSRGKGKQYKVSGCSAGPSRRPSRACALKALKALWALKALKALKALPSVRPVAEVLRV
jgi:hypothetical protein